MANTAEEKAERRRVVRSVLGKSLAAAAGASFLVFVVVAAGGHPFYGFIFGCGAFGVAIWVALIGFGVSETDQSKQRLAERAEIRRVTQQREEQARQQALAMAERDRLKVQSDAVDRERAVLEEQKLRDDREFILRKLTNTNNYLDLYDPANAVTRDRVRQAISQELSDIMVKHTRWELTSLLERDPDVRGMAVAMSARLKSKNIDSAEASQILAAMR